MRNDFIMTSFMYPLDIKDRPYIFGKLYFDNPRTNEEINYVAQRLKEINYSYRPFPDRPGLVPENCVTLMSIYDCFIENNSADALVKKFNKRYGRIKDIYKKLARMWVVVRSEQIISEEDTKGKFTFFKENEDDMAIQIIDDIPLSITEYNEEKINDIFAFLSFMLGKGNLSNHLLSADNLGLHKHDSSLFLQLMVMATNNSYENDDESEIYHYGAFRVVEPKIIKLSNAVGEKYLNQKFQFICKKIRHILELYNINQEMTFVELISVIEMFITHNPNSGRFNIEDSITKQFVGKLLLIIYESNKDTDLEQLKKELKFAYSIRSAIAHGDFSNLERQLNKLFEFYNFKRDEKGIDYRDNNAALYKLIDNAHSWVEAVINLYLEDEKRLELIKLL